MGLHPGENHFGSAYHSPIGTNFLRFAPTRLFNDKRCAVAAQVDTIEEDILAYRRSPG